MSIGYSIEGFQKNKGKAEALYENGFSSKAQKQNCLDYINSAFNNASWLLQHEILKERASFEEGSNQYNELTKIYFDVPHSCYFWKEKISRNYEKYEIAKQLNELKAFYDKVKAIEVTKVILSPVQKKELKVKETLDKVSNISDKFEYLRQAKEMAELLRPELEEKAKESATKMISYLNMPKEQIEELCKNKNFKNMYNSFVFGNTEENIKRYFQQEVELTILEVELKIIDSIKFDINNYKLIENLSNSIKYEINNSKIFEIRTIYAGGYNVQCFHIRVLTYLYNL